MAEQRSRPCGHFGSIEFELLQILQGRREGNWPRFSRFALVWRPTLKLTQPDSSAKAKFSEHRDGYRSTGLTGETLDCRI